MSEQSDYHRFTGKARLDRDIHTLEGIVQGIVADSRVNNIELEKLVTWLEEHRDFVNRHPFNEVIPVLDKILADERIDDEERADLLWLCEKFTTDNNYYESASSDIQRLQGFLTGILTDGIINEDELSSLAAWLDSHTHLRTIWPYDEIESLITSVMEDQRIDELEQQHLKQFFEEFSNSPRRRAVGYVGGEETVTGICAMCPEIIFNSRFFCFTGESKRGSRTDLAEVVRRRGGDFHKGLRKDTNYLIVGADGNPCWAFACYGRKIEQAMFRRREGQSIQIVHENDFWDAAVDCPPC
jgi:hypothetical protein